MSDIDDPGDGATVTCHNSALPATSVWAEGGKRACGAAIKMRSFEEIVADAKANRNILEIHLKKNLNDDSPTSKLANLTYDKLGELLFDIRNIKSDECIKFNFSTSRYDTRGGRGGEGGGGEVGRGEGGIT